MSCKEDPDINQYTSLVDYNLIAVIILVCHIYILYPLVKFFQLLNFSIRYVKHDAQLHTFELRKYWL